MAMSALRRVTFEHEKCGYEIRVMFREGVFTVLSFRDNHPANGFRHCLMIPKHADPEHVMTTGVMDELIAMAQDDIITERWKRVAIMW